MKFDTTVPPADPRGEELEARADRIASDWLACRRTSVGQLDYFGDEPLRPGDKP